MSGLTACVLAVVSVLHGPRGTAAAQGPASHAAPAADVRAIVGVIEMAFDTRLTEAQRARIAAAPGAADANARQLTQTATRLQAETNAVTGWLRSAHQAAQKWLAMLATGDAALAAMERAGDRNGAAPGLSVRARDAVAEMLLLWVSLASGQPPWEGGDADRESLESSIASWYRAAPEETRALLQHADRIWGGVRAEWLKGDAESERAKAQLQRDLPGLLTARQQGGRRWWTHPAVAEAVTNGTLIRAAAAVAVRPDLSLTGDSPYYDAPEMKEPAVAGSPKTKRQMHDVVLFFSFALDAVLTLSERDAIVEGLGSAEAARSDFWQETTKLIGEVMDGVRTYHRRMIDGRRALRQQVLAAPGVLGEVGRRLADNQRPLVASDPYQLNRQHLEAMAEFLVFSDSTRRGQWITLDAAGRDKLVAVLLDFFKRAGPSDRLAFASADLLWGQFRETADYRASAQRLSAAASAASTAPGSYAASAVSDPVAALRAEHTNSMIQRSFNSAFQFNVSLGRIWGR